MNFSEILEIFKYTIPSLITGLVAYYFFLNHTKMEEKNLKIRLLKQRSKQTLPIKLQAYERMTLFLERINLTNLVVRINSVNNDKNAYVASLLNTIEQEFEHNLVQQIYISDECWSLIVASKNAVIQEIKKASIANNITNAQELREEIIKKQLTNSNPTSKALLFLKDEVSNYFQ